MSSSSNGSLARSLTAIIDVCSKIAACNFELVLVITNRLCVSVRIKAGHSELVLREISVTESSWHAVVGRSPQCVFDVTLRTSERLL